MDRPNDAIDQLYSCRGLSIQQSTALYDYICYIETQLRAVQVDLDNTEDARLDAEDYIEGLLTRLDGIGVLALYPDRI